MTRHPFPETHLGYSAQGEPALVAARSLANPAAERMAIDGGLFVARIEAGGEGDGYRPMTRWRYAGRRD